MKDLDLIQFVGVDSFRVYIHYDNYGELNAWCHECYKDFKTENGAKKHFDKMTCWKNFL